MRRFTLVEAGSALAIVCLLAFNAAAEPHTKAWSIATGYSITSSPALSTNGILYFGSWDHCLYAVGTHEAAIRWKFETGLEIKSSPAIADDGTIYVGSRDRKFYAVTPDGKLKWSFPTDGWVDSSPAVATNGTIYFGSWDKNFYALNPDGSRKWVFTNEGEIVSSPAVGADGTIYFGSHDKKIYALNPDGSKRWSYTTGGPIVSSPAIDFSGLIYFTSVDGKFYVLNPDGTLHWSLRTGSYCESSPVLDPDGTIFIGINNMRTAFTRDGKFKWDLKSNELIDSAGAVTQDNAVCQTSRDGALVAVRQNSDFLWHIALGASITVSPTVGPDGMVYVAAFSGELAAVKGSAGLAKSGWPMFHANPRHTGVVNSPGK